MQPREDGVRVTTDGDRRARIYCAYFDFPLDNDGRRKLRSTGRMTAKKGFGFYILTRTVYVINPSRDPVKFLVVFGI